VHPIRFGISRAHGGARLVEGVRLLGAALEGVADRPVRLVLADDYEQLLVAVRDAAIDLAWLPPLLQAQARAAGAVLLAVAERAGAARFRAAILVRADSARRTLADLDGARAAWGDPASASGHHEPSRRLAAAGVTVGRAAFYGSARAAAAAVLDGAADFCACFVHDAAAADPALARADVEHNLPEAAGRLRVIDVGDPIAPDGIVIAPGADAALRAALGDALVRLHRAPAGLVALQVLMGAERLVPPPEPSA
jgi:ABC-type phosphate/phosphonate transport system substrate-binding protein